MASTAANLCNTSGAPSAKVDELRGVLASKGLVVKDSILVRLAKSKSFQGTLTLAQDSEGQQERSAQSTDNGVPSEASVTQKSKQVEASKLKQEVSADNTTDMSNLSGSSDTNNGNLPPTKDGGQSVALGDVALHSSEEEKKQRRTDRFGTVSDDEKLKQRAARFGITQDVIEEAEKKRARAARFGIVDEDAKKKARLERFGKETEQEDKEEIEKRKARALRFAPPTERSLSEAELN